MTRLRTTWCFLTDLVKKIVAAIQGRRQQRRQYRLDERWIDEFKFLYEHRVGYGFTREHVADRHA